MAASILLAVLFGGGLILIARWRIFGSRSCAVRFQPAMMRRKTVIVTGANSGIGKETTAGLLRLSARVIMACRDRSRAERAAAEIRDLVGSSEGELIIKQLDLSSLDSVRAFCNDIIQEEPRVDVLINNAGVYRCPYTRTHDGFEMQWGVNHLGHFLLTRLLTDLLQKSAPSRVVVVSSKLYKNGSIEFEDVNGEGGYNAAFSYSQSKLANLLFSRQLARQLEGTGVTANALSPGIVRTHLGRYVHVPPLAKPLLWLVSQLFFKSPAEGAKTSLYLACSPDVENITGKFFANCREEVLLPIATDDQVAQRLWDLSESMVGLKIKS